MGCDEDIKATTMHDADITNKMASGQESYMVNLQIAWRHANAREIMRIEYHQEKCES